jgi:perosamine synthetase
MIKLASPDIRQSDIDRVIRVIKSGDLVQGKYVKKFERELSMFADIPYCAVTSSCTTALLLSLLSLGIGHGDTVIVPAFTFPATANVVESVGASIVLCDVDPANYVVTPSGIEDTIKKNCNKKIKAVIVVHEFGYPAHICEIRNITKKYGIRLIEDAACALGTMVDGQHVGSYSDVACLSFHPRKAITSGEGGALLSRNAELIQKAKLLRNHGIIKNNTTIDFIAPGLNYRMTDLQAALAIGQLQRFGEELRIRRKLAQRYISNLFHFDHVQSPVFSTGHSWQTFMVVLGEKIDQMELIKRLFEEGVQANLGAQAINCLTYFKDKYHFKVQDMPVASVLYKRGLALPIYGKLTTDEIFYITDLFKNLVNHMVSEKPNL